MHIQRHKRPRMEDLVKVSGLQAPLRENRLVVREFQFQQRWAARGEGVVGGGGVGVGGGVRLCCCFGGCCR